MSRFCTRFSLLAALMVAFHGPVQAQGAGGVEILQVEDGGQPLPIPGKGPDAPPPPPPKQPGSIQRPPPDAEALYTVRPGDTLSQLAARLLGNEERWPEIFAANRDIVQNPNLIKVGQVLRIPVDGPAVMPPAAGNTAPGLRADPGEPAGWSGGKLPPREFINLLGPAAREVAQRTGVPASVTLAQAILETGWGRSTIRDAKNLFGIKGHGPAGSITVPTREVVNGRSITVQGTFRKYNSWQESIQDHADFLVDQRRYRNAFRSGNPDQFARAITAAGYATDPAYADSLIRLMKQYNLYQWDH